MSTSEAGQKPFPVALDAFHRVRCRLAKIGLLVDVGGGEFLSGTGEFDIATATVSEVEQHGNTDQRQQPCCQCRQPWLI